MENEKGIVKLTRKQLYDEIWALSVAGVARKYNLNYGKLIATCKVENISFPSSGYWTKKDFISHSADMGCRDRKRGAVGASCSYKNICCIALRRMAFTRRTLEAGLSK